MVNTSIYSYTMITRIRYPYTFEDVGGQCMFRRCLLRICFIYHRTTSIAFNKIDNDAHDCLITNKT